MKNYDIPQNALIETWDSVYKLTVALAAKIEKHCKETREKFDKIIVVPRGSYYPVNIISRELGFESTDLLHACLSSYVSGKAERKAEFKFGQMPDAKEIAGKNLLIIEEVCDSGQTLQYLHDLFMGQCARLVRTATLHYKPAKSQTGFKPDWFAEETDKWIVYPWEKHENIKT